MVTEKAKAVIENHRFNESQTVDFKSLDVASSYETIATAFDEIQSRAPIFMLVNCAGQAICGTVDAMSPTDARRLMDVNYYGTYHPTKCVLASMKKARDGIIVITGSMAGLFGIYGYGAYAATKFALRGLAETIAAETTHYGISVTLALPADTDTPGLATENKTKPEATKQISGPGGIFHPEEVARRIVADALVSFRRFKWRERE